jgi:hypothetical protein
VAVVVTVAMHSSVNGQAAQSLRPLVLIEFRRLGGS